MIDINDLKKKVLEHDKEINKQEIALLEEIKKEASNFTKKLDEIKSYLSYLEDFNNYEINNKPKLKEDELEILYNLYNKYKEVSDSFSKLYKKLLEYYRLVKREII